MLTGRNIEAPDGLSRRLCEHPVEGASAAVVLVHGSTFGFRAGFAPGGDRRFWADAIADAGRTVVGIDLQGYGDSERPPAMEAPPEANPPVARAAAVASDVGLAVEHARSRAETVHLVGISWGTVVCGALFDGGAPPVDSLTLYAPLYELPAADPAAFDPGDPPAAYREVTRAGLRARWNEQVPAGVDPVAWRGGEGDDDPLFEAVWEAASDTRQRVEGADEPTIRVPNGSLLDMRAAARGEPVYDPADVDVPTLVVRGSQDATSAREDALAAYDAVGADHAEYLEIDAATHFLLVEPRRHALYGAANGFYDRVERK